MRRMTRAKVSCITCCEDALMNDRDIYIMLLKDVEEAP